MLSDKMDWLSEWLEPEYSDVEDGEIITEENEIFFHTPFPRNQPYLKTIFSTQAPTAETDTLEQYGLLSTLHLQLYQLHAAMEQCTQTISLLLSTGTIRLNDLLHILEPSRIHEPLHRSIRTPHLFENFASA
jgi:hypothetical protein